MVAKRGRSPAGGRTSAERSETSTAELFFSDIGVYSAPMLIFPMVKVNNEFLEGKPPNAHIYPLVYISRVSKALAMLTASLLLLQ